MSNDSTGRTPRSAGNSAPMGSTIAIVVTAVAVILGFLILRTVNDNHDTNSVGPKATTPATTQPATNTTLPIPTTTAAPVSLTATKVQVANASKVSGVAKQLTNQLKAAGFDMVTATNATITTPAPSTKVIYNQSDPKALGVATAVAKALGGVPVEIADNPPHVKDGTFAAGSAVIVLLGLDLAGKPLADPGLTGVTTPPSVTAVQTTA